MADAPRRTEREPALISVVAPVFNEEETIARFCERVCAVLEDVPFELVLVEDGSSDETAATLAALAERDERLRVVFLSRNFGHQAALTAGLDHARGEVVVMLDSDLQDPPELIPSMLAHWRRGSDVVYAVREQRPGEGRFKLATARWFYRAFNALAPVGVEPNSGDYRLLDRRALDALLRMPERHRFLRGMSVWIGFTQTAIPYAREPRGEGETKYTLGRMLRLSIDGIASFSHVPLQLASWLGFVFSFLAFLAIPVIVVLRIAGHYIPGFAAVTIVILLLGGIQLITIGIIGEYLGRIYDEVKGRPLYFVRRTINVGDLDREPPGGTSEPARLAGP